MIPPTSFFSSMQLQCRKTKVATFYLTLNVSLPAFLHTKGPYGKLCFYMTERGDVQHFPSPSGPHRRTERDFLYSVFMVVVRAKPALIIVTDRLLALITFFVVRSPFVLPCRWSLNYSLKHDLKSFKWVTVMLHSWNILITQFVLSKRLQQMRLTIMWWANNNKCIRVHWHCN